MAEKGAWLFKSHVNGSWAEGLRKQLKVCPFFSESPKAWESLRKNILKFPGGGGEGNPRPSES